VRFFPGCGFVIRSALLVNSPVPNFLLDELWLEFMISLLEFLPLYMLCSNGCPEAKRKNCFGIIRACEIAVFLRQLSCTVVPKQFLSNFSPGQWPWNEPKTKRVYFEGFPFNSTGLV
jgi:hypothetical protein